jgi:hypothetical protein
MMPYVDIVEFHKTALETCKIRETILTNIEKNSQEKIIRIDLYTPI